MRWFWKLLSKVNDVTSFAALVGLPVSALATFTAVVWAYVAHLRISYVMVVAALVCACTLWSWIGVIWLWDRGRSVNYSKPSLDCAWGLTIDAAFVTFDPANTMIAAQVSVQLRNLLSWPIRCEILKYEGKIDGKVPDQTVASSPPAIVMPGGISILAFDGYGQNILPVKTNYIGQIKLWIKYGHPDIGLSREMMRDYSFSLQVQLNPLIRVLQPNSAATPPVVGKFPVALASVKEDEDKPLK